MPVLSVLTPGAPAPSARAPAGFLITTTAARHTSFLATTTLIKWSRNNIVIFSEVCARMRWVSPRFNTAWKPRLTNWSSSWTRYHYWPYGIHSYKVNRHLIPVKGILLYLLFFHLSPCTFTTLFFLAATEFPSTYCLFNTGRPERVSMSPTSTTLSVSA
jgi:hypothetical protein